MSAKFYELAQQQRVALTRFLQDLVSIPSLSGQEGAVVERAAAEMKKLGYDEVTVDPMGNLIGRIGSGPIKIAIDGHCDTVDIGQASLWKRDPYKAEVENAILYGRGASDQKGGVASAIYAAPILQQAGFPERATLYVVVSVQEEDCEGLCWQYLIQEDHLQPEVVVLTEPSHLRICRGQRGHMGMEIATEGLSCHGSMPECGVNAIYKMAPILQDIEKLNERLPSSATLGKGNIMISHIRSTSPSLSAVADGCIIHLDRRLTAGETETTAVKELEDLPSVQAGGAKVKVLEYAVPSYTGLVHPTRQYYPAWEFPESAPHVQKAIAAYRRTFDGKPEVGLWAFSTNGVATAGMHGIPSLGFGPGHEKFAHAPNEQIEIEHLVRAAAFYAAFVTEFAG
ncbi:MAG: YgeY family selenium metabolism-linked hydrolase [Verrucomicrobia bacterium]|nr:YgeY family selenium metabolism-linked hydrolase [Verrucomicrobiota bacterium]MBU1910048.1 YgeY family selenium metabolism-linked hydrolase [Verrucomicrobiota bacterium]